MSLPILPQLTNNDKTDIALLYGYLRQLILSFANAAGSAIDPSVGEGGDSSLTITEAPTGITYTPTSSIAIDGTVYGAIDITFIKPDRAVCVIVYYREVGVANFKQSFAFSSPFRLINLKAGIRYQLYLAGQAANNDISNVLSPLTIVAIPFGAVVIIGSPAHISDIDLPDEPMMIPGPTRPQGLQGIPGLDGISEVDSEPVLLVRDLPTVGRILTALDNLSAFGITTSAQLAGVISDETGTGALVFGTAPTITGYLTLGTLTLRMLSTGSSPVIGEAILVAGTKAVLSDAITSDSQVLLTRKTSGGTIGTGITYTLQTSAPKGFTINSNNPLDTSTFTWVILERF